MRCHGSMKGRLFSKRNRSRWKTGKTSIDEAVTVCSQMRPYRGQSADMLRRFRTTELTGPSIRLRRIIDSRFADIAVLIPGSAMESNTKALCQWQRGRGVKRASAKHRLQYAGKSIAAIY